MKNVNEPNLWPISGMLLAAALVAFTGVDGPIIDSAGNASPEQWLGFAGSIIGGLFTIIAAYIAWRSVSPQIAELRRQSAATARQLLVQKAEDLEIELSACGVLLKALGEAQLQISIGLYLQAVEYEKWIEDCRAAVALVGKSRIEYFARSRRQYGTDYASAPRYTMVSNVSEIESKAYYLIGGIVARNYSGRLEKDRSITEREISRFIEHIIDVRRSAENVLGAASGETQEAWQRVRELEGSVLHSTVSGAANSGP